MLFFCDTSGQLALISVKFYISIVFMAFTFSAQLGNLFKILFFLTGYLIVPVWNFSLLRLSFGSSAFQCWLILSIYMIFVRAELLLNWCALLFWLLLALFSIFFLWLALLFVCLWWKKKPTGSDHNKTLEIKVQNTTLKIFPFLKFWDKLFCFVF